MDEGREGGRKGGDAAGGIVRCPVRDIAKARPFRAALLLLNTFLAPSLLLVTFAWFLRMSPLVFLVLLLVLLFEVCRHVMMEDVCSLEGGVEGRKEKKKKKGGIECLMRYTSPRYKVEGYK